MADYFITGLDGIKRGPFSEQKLREMMAQGIIGPDTPVGTDTGVTVLLSEFLRSMHTSGQVQTAKTEFRIPDIGFVHFLTPILVTITWWLTVITTIGSCLYVMYQISSSPLPNEAKGIGCLLVIVIAVDGLLWCRIILECVAIFFRMERHQRTIKEILERNEKASKP